MEIKRIRGAKYTALNKAHTDRIDKKVLQQSDPDRNYISDAFSDDFEVPEPELENIYKFSAVDIKQLTVPGSGKRSGLNKYKRKKKKGKNSATHHHVIQPPKVIKPARIVDMSELIGLSRVIYPAVPMQPKVSNSSAPKVNQSQASSRKLEDFTEVIADDPASTKSFRSNLKRPAFLVGSLIKLIAVGLSVVLIVQILSSKAQQDILTRWTTTPMAVVASALLIITIFLKELLGHFQGKLAGHLRLWLTFLIPLLLLIFVSIFLNKFNLVYLGS